MQPSQWAAVLRRLRRELEAIDAESEALGVTEPQARALLALAAAEGAPDGVRALGAELLVDKSTISRLVAQLVDAGWVRTTVDRRDRRRKPLALTAKGRRVAERIAARTAGAASAAIADWPEEERAALPETLARLARSLERARRRGSIALRRIARADDPGVAEVIRTVMPEFGATGSGFAIADPEVDAMHAAYRGRRARYWVLDDGGRVVGGGGLAPLDGGPPAVCELRKMYLLPEARGLGFGRELLDRALAHAAAVGYRQCYVETFHSMTGAIALYERAGFARCGRMGDTGHGGCDVFYVKDV